MNQVSLKDKTNAFSKIDFRTYTMVLALILIAIFFQIVTNGVFGSSRNLSNLFRQMSITGVITMGMVLLIISGNFDLAVGSIVALTGGIAAVLQVWFGFNTFLAITIAICLGALVGLWQGFWVAYRKVPSFIVTLGNMLAIRGIFLVVTQGITVTPLDTSFSVISQSYLSSTFGVIIGAAAAIASVYMIISRRISRKKYGFQVESKWITALKIVLSCSLIFAFITLMNTFKGIPTPVLILLVLIMIFVFISTKTRFGRRVYAIGGNPEAARLSGINVKRYVTVLYIITGVLAAISGILLTSRLDGAVSAAGQAYEMDVISACVIGGTSLSGGKGTIYGAIIGALIIASLDNGMSLLNVTYYYQSIVKGLVLIFAVWFDVASQKKAA